MRRSAWSILAAPIAASAFLPGLAHGADPDSADSAPPRDPSVLRRLVRHFDFEERERRPQEMPDFWLRYGRKADGERGSAAAEGFPDIGRMHLVDDHAARGRWSFRFDLDGGSMAARVAGGVLPVMPFVDYHVRAMGRTEGLEHARIRMTAWLEDQRGEIVPGSRRDSPPIRPNGAWTPLAVAIDGTHADVAFLRVELQLLQPRHLGAGSRRDAPIPQDLSGFAWFDDLAVWSVPRVSISTGAPGNVLEAGPGAMLTVTVDDLVSDAIAATVTLEDVDGRPALRETIAAPHPLSGHELDLSGLPHGWYRVTVDLDEADQAIARHETALVVLDPTPRPGGAGLGVAMDRLGPADLALAVRLGIDTLVLTARPEQGDELITALGSLLSHDRRTILIVDETPARLVALFGGSDAPLEKRDAEFAGLLDHVILNYGTRIHRWRLNDAGAGPGALARVLPTLSVMRPWPAEEAIPPTRRWAGHHVTVPWRVSPEAIGELAAAWGADPADVLVTLELSPPDLYAPRDRVIDLLRRGLATWRAGHHDVVIDAPWRPDPGVAGGPPRPDPTLAAWRELAARLAGRRFGGELDLGPGRQAWILLGPGPDDGAIVAWAEAAAPDGIAPLRMNLGPAPVVAVDAFGNRRRIAAVDDQHEIPLGPTPRFIEGIDPHLAAFRATFAFEPAVLPTANRRLVRTVIVHNPWSVNVTGTLRFTDDEPWRISPRVIQLSMEPGETVRREVYIVPTRGLVEGHRAIAADFELIGRETHRFRAEAPVEVGLPGIEMRRAWRLVANPETGGTDLEIRLQVTNVSAAPRSLEAFVTGRSLPLERRPIGVLGPGQTAHRTVRVVNGAAVLSGHTIRIGVDDREQSARLTQELRLPVFDRNLAVGR